MPIMHVRKRKTTERYDEVAGTYEDCFENLDEIALKISRWDQLMSQSVKLKLGLLVK